MPFYVLIPLLGIPVWLGILAYAIALAAKNADAQTRKQLERYEGEPKAVRERVLSTYGGEG